MYRLDVILVKLTSRISTSCLLDKSQIRKREPQKFLQEMFFVPKNFIISTYISIKQKVSQE